MAPLESAPNRRCRTAEGFEENGAFFLGHLYLAHLLLDELKGARCLCLLRLAALLFGGMRVAARHPPLVAPPCPNRRRSPHHTAHAASPPSRIVWMASAYEQFGKVDLQDIG